MEDDRQLGTPKKSSNVRGRARAHLHASISILRLVFLFVDVDFSANDKNDKHTDAEPEPAMMAMNAVFWSESETQNTEINTDHRV